jgi:alkanesulfonate monooxygenase SsuD/methylene tetrahydromethanopterin reductase-like flavin-dependent oxidoreductase (luciferase family)
VEFNHFLSSYYPDTNYGSDRLYGDMLTQARMAETLGYRGVTIPEHHLINILLVPDPLQFAVKVASITQRLEVVTSVSVLPIHDMRIFAGEAIQAYVLCDGRLTLGVGRGAFAYELARLGKPISESRERFDESLEILLALLSREEVDWSGKYYQFEKLTVMPRLPHGHSLPIMVAALVPAGIEASAKRGFHIQTAALDGTLASMREQVAAFHRGKTALGAAGSHLRLAVSRACCVAADERDARKKLAYAYEFYGRFQNVFTGPGLVDRGAIRHLPLKQTMEELEQSLVICPAAEMVDRLKEYEAIGIDELIMNLNIGQSQSECLEAMERFGAEVMPHFKKATGDQIPPVHVAS